MSIQELTQIQLDAIMGATKVGLLVQILPNEKLDSEKIFTMWSGRVSQVDELVGSGFLEEKDLSGYKYLDNLKQQYPDRGFKVFAPTELAINMFANPAANKDLN